MSTIAAPAPSPAVAAAPTAPLAVSGLHKRYGGVQALRGADLRITRAGSVHGLIGANGSGKSTLLGILSGQVRPDAGSITLDGAPVTLTTPLSALRHGIAMVSQETALAPALSIAENVFLGRRHTRRRVRGIDWAATNERAGELLAQLGVHEDPATPVGRLRPDRRQMVEIARAISLDARILILDEPTSSLNDAEVEALFAVVRRLRDRGVATIFVSHRLPELLALSDELTVLRDGRTVATGPIADFDAHQIVDAMVGRAGAWAERPRPVRTHRPAARPPALQVRGLSLPGSFEGLDLHVEEGEVVGLAGSVGAGRSDLLEVIFGVIAPDEGSMELEGRPYSPRGPRHAIRRGLGYLPPDRKHQGLVLRRSVAENLALVATRDRGRLRRPGGPSERAIVESATATMNIVAASPDVAVATLSGGNQQKVALGKWIAGGSRVLLLNEPTRGVDVAAKAEIHTLLRAAAGRGAALLVSSSEPQELLELCDRILVFGRGRIVASLTSAEATEETIAHHIGGWE